MTGEKHKGYMFDIIASSFFQKKTCRLPGIGNLELVTTAAEYDYGSKLIRAPRQTVLFVSASYSSKDQFNEFSAISQLMKDELNRNGIVRITGLGSFTKDSADNIHFAADQVNDDFFQPVAAEKVIHKDAAHSILVGDMQTTNVQMNEYYSDEPVETKDRWWVWAIALAVVGIAAISYYLYANGYTSLGSKSLF